MLKRTAMMLLVVQCSCMATFAQSPSDDPYQLTFADFAWDQRAQSEKIDGALLLGERMETSKAIAIFEDRVSRNRSDVASRTVLGELYLRFAKEHDDLPSYDRSEAMLRSAIALDPESVGARLNLAHTLMAKHRFAEALELAQAVQSVASHSQVCRAIVFDCLLELGQYELAQVALEKLVDESDSPEFRAKVLARHARLEEIHGKTRRSIERIETCIKLDPGLGWYRWRLGCLQFSIGEVELARTAFLEGLEIDPEDGPCLTDLAKCEYALGNNTQAMVHLRNAVTLHAEPPMMSLLGDLHFVAGNQQEAEKWYKKTELAMRAEAKVAGDAHAREVALFFADHDRNIAESVTLAEKDLLVRQDVFTYDTLAWAYCKAGRIDEATKAIQTALRHGTLAPAINYHAAIIYDASGNVDRANFYWNQLCDTNPSFSILYAKRAKAKCGQLE